MKGIEQRRTKRSGKQRRKQISSLEAEEMDQVKSSIAYCGIAVPSERKNTEVLVSGKIRSSRVVLNLTNTREKCFLPVIAYNSASDR